METFRRKSITRSKTLGERLRKVREELGSTLEEAAAAIQIRREYLAALESGNYTALPGPVYIENFLKRYARYLGVSEDFVLEVYRQRERRVVKNNYQPRFTAPRRSLPKALITPQRIRALVIVLVIAACLTYLSFAIMKIFSPPSLIVNQPSDYFTSTTVTVTVAGTTEPEATVTINGREIYLDSQGGFSEQVTLREGINIIIIAASKKRSKPTEVQRHVLLEQTTE